MPVIRKRKKIFFLKLNSQSKNFTITYQKTGNIIIKVKKKENLIREIIGSPILKNTNFCLKVFSKYNKIFGLIKKFKTNMIKTKNKKR